MKWVHLSLLLILFTFVSNNILASSLSINPVLLTLTNEEPVSTMTLTNLSDNTVTVQADVVSWLQNMGMDINRHTSDMLISPPLFEIQAHQSQLLRVAWLNKHALNEQLTYRVILREIVTHKIIPQGKEGDLQIALVFSIPLFVQPPVQNVLYQWEAKWHGKNKLKLNLNNPGNMTVFVNQIQLRNTDNILLDRKMFAYILPKKNHVFELNIKKTSALNISARINGEWKTDSVQIKK